MAARALVLLVAWLCYVSGQQVTPSDNYVVNVVPTSCRDAEVDGAFTFFDSVTMACKKCSQNSTLQKTSSDGMSCECLPKHRYTRRFGGDQVTCEACGSNEVVSTDGWECKLCANGSTDCNCDAAKTITVERGLDGRWVNPGPPQKDQCVACEGNTVPNAQGDRCIRCSDDLNLGFSTCPTCPDDQKADGFCFRDPDDLLPSTPLLFEIPRIDGTGNTQSKYFETHLIAAYTMCTKYQNVTACQVVANLCALTLYNERQGRICNNIITTVPAGTPSQILYYSDDAEDVVGSKDILDTYTLSPPTTLPLEAAVHTLEGRYLGNRPLTDGLLQLCDTTETIANAAYLFGTYYTYKCTIKAKGLWDTVKHPLLFYDIYLKYKDSDQQRLFKVPLVIEDIRDQSDDLINTGVVKDWRITRRMFLVDNQMEIPSASTGSGADGSGTPSAEALYVRYAKDITLHISLQDDTANGRIEVPHFTVKYGEVSLEKANNNDSVQISFTTTYTMSWSFFRRNFQIAVGTLGCMATLYAGFRSWVWSKRAGRPSIDFPTLVNLLLHMAAALSYMFFIITFCLAFYWFIFFKRQDVVYLVHPDGKLVEEWEGLFYGAFTLRCLSLVHLLVMQCSADVFLVDWERPRGVKTGQDGKKGVGGAAAAVPVSIWRTYFVANEWNEIQAVRKINSNLQVLAVVFLLKVVGFEQTTSMDPEGQVERDGDGYTAQQSPIYRYALAALVYILVAVVQWVLVTFIYERFVEDKVQQFVDLCSMSNVSVFVMAHAHFGYYIHGRSVHGKADTDLQEMADMMKREEEDMCGKRGLVPDTEEQTFIMSLPKRLRVKYEQVYLPAALENAGAMARTEQGGATGSRLTGGTKEKSVEAYHMLNKFLCGFIDHSLRDVDYVVKDKTLLETLMDTEFIDTTEKGIFYKDNGHSFDQVLFYGHEMALLVFDVLLFCVVDRIWQNYLLDGFIVFLVSNLVRMIRDTAGKKNLVRKTLVDERFLI